MPTRSDTEFSPSERAASIANMSEDAPLTRGMLNQAMKETMQLLLKEILNDILQPMLQGLKDKVSAKIVQLSLLYKQQ